MTASVATLKVPAAAKINLYLHVTGLSDGGYHTLDSLVAFAGIHDTITLTLPPASAPHLSLTVVGPFADGLDTGDDNLVMKAADRLRRASGYEGGCAIELEKNLPVSAGIGGGSADAAAVLGGLVRLWNLDADALDLNDLGLSLGADVPVCLFGQAAYVGGIGEEITRAPALPAAWLVLINPGAQVSTPAVFNARQETNQGRGSGTDRFKDTPATAAVLAEYLNARGNDLSEAAIGLQPVIEDVLAALKSSEDVLLARMSGSGATCFGLYADADGAARAAAALNQQHPGWWVQATPLLSDTRPLAG
ncbi:MAG: 4-(cytidine 5'-diphospho)-2-C-methyl-D-erythritol kinase [Proteobacteria bacterium]|nr:4-(cytidine 5'-diphospho)-2-C-methyl-D-erythritol kinase [Pseudomonadota bacterium]